MRGSETWQGSVASIHIAPKESAPSEPVAEIRAVPGRGLEGDRYYEGLGFYSNKPGGGREVTLIEVETLAALDHELGIKLSPAEARRNIATVGVPLNHLVDREFWVGEVLMRGVRLCEPCQHLEEVTGKRVVSGLVHRGGLRAQILSEGKIRVGDLVRPKTP